MKRELSRSLYDLSDIRYNFINYLSNVTPRAFSFHNTILACFLKWRIDKVYDESDIHREIGFIKRSELQQILQYLLSEFADIEEDIFENMSNDWSYKHYFPDYDELGIIIYESYTPPPTKLERLKQELIEDVDDWSYVPERLRHAFGIT